MAEYESRAREVLPRGVFDYYAGGGGDEWTLAENNAAFRRHRLRPRVLVDVSSCDLATTVLGTRIDLPVMVAPTALHRMANPEGEVATARAAAAAGSVLVLSTLASCTIEEVAGAAAGPRWFQLYVQRDRDATISLVRRAEEAGYGAIVLTVDLPVVGSRDRDTRNAFTVPAGIGYANLGVRPRDPSGSDFAALINFLGDPTFSWRDLEWLRSLSSLPLVLKGVMTAEDAALAVEAGVEAVVVSNHGGRQLDGVAATIDVLPEVVEAVGGRAEVYLDGGVRRGGDILVALALGAQAVLVGRPILWGLAVDGEDGVRHVLELFRSELEVAMALSGCRSVAEVTPALVRRA